mmetsp:Transcript_38590/g.36940  ORF Transcript_38590/g.36940 Transcript_38590/m.36940 type:complete len:117 (+) Transcript_38590:297-647(+)
MMGSGLVSMPHAFESAGFLLGLIICIIGGICCCRTCILVIRTVGDDPDYQTTLFKYWGKWGYYLGGLATLLICVAAVCSFFIILSEMLYPIIVALVDWISGKDIYEVKEMDGFVDS